MDTIDPETETLGTFSLQVLDKQTAQIHAPALAKLLDQIPLVNYTEKEVLAESKEGRIFYGKWRHSLVLLDQAKPIGAIIGYERKSEANQQYPENTLYISELVVDPDYQKQGLGRKLVQAFLNHNQKIGFLYLEGPLNFSVQTNSARWNSHVQNLYQSLGFTKRAIKQYDNRTDVILELKP